MLNLSVVGTEENPQSPLHHHPKLAYSLCSVTSLLDPGQSRAGSSAALRGAWQAVTGAPPHIIIGVTGGPPQSQNGGHQWLSVMSYIHRWGENCCNVSNASFSMIP